MIEKVIKRKETKSVGEAGSSLTSGSNRGTAKAFHFLKRSQEGGVWLRVRIIKHREHYEEQCFPGRFI